MNTLVIKTALVKGEVKYKVSVRMDTVPFTYSYIDTFNSHQEAKRFVESYYANQSFQEAA